MIQPQQMSSLNGKRKNPAMECESSFIQNTSKPSHLVSMSFGDSIIDNYFEGLQTVFGPKRASILLLKIQDRFTEIRTNSQVTQKSSSELYMSLFQLMHKQIESKLNQEIQLRVSSFQACIENVKRFSEIPSASSILMNLLLKGEYPKASKPSLELIESIKHFIGGETILVELIHHAIMKLDRSSHENKNSNSNSISEEQHTHHIEDDILSLSNSTLSDESEENSLLVYSKLPDKFKATVLSRIMPSLAAYSEKIAFIRNFALLSAI